MKEDSHISQDIFKLLQWGNMWQMAIDVNKCKLLLITYRKSTAIKSKYNMYQANASSDNNSPAVALLDAKHIGFSVPTTDFIQTEETQNESYLDVIFDNK